MAAWIDRVRESLGSRGRPVRRTLATASNLEPTIDIGNADYDWWARAVKGKVNGIEISSLLLKPLVSKIASWTLSHPPTIVFKNRTTQKFVADWMSTHYKLILGAVEDSLTMGDSYILVNADLSVAVLPPDIVTPIVDEKNYSVILGWKVTQTIQHPEKPSQKMKIVDEFTKNRRKRTITVDNKPIFAKVYNNLIGRIPVVHIPNNPAPWKRFGSPEGEALVPLFQRYNEVFLAAVEGNKRQGRPTPVISKLGTPQEVDQFWKQYGKSGRQEMPDGSVESYQYIEFDSDKVITLGGDANFAWEAPGSFTADTAKLLELMYYLYLQHSELPEAILGNAVQVGSESSNLLEPLIKFIEKKRTLVEPWMKELVMIAAAYRGLYERAIKAAEEDITIYWMGLTRQDGQLTLQSIQWLYLNGLIDRKTALSLVPVEIADPEQVLKDAETDYPKRPVQGYPTQDNGSRDPQKDNNPTDNDSERSRRRSGTDRSGKLRNRRSDSKSTSPYANSNGKN